MHSKDAPYHIHVYSGPAERPRAEALRDRLRGLLQSGTAPGLLMVGPILDGPVGPHPLPQFEVHLRRRALPQVLPSVEAAGLTALVHPVTDDDLADHTALAQWIGDVLELDLATLDPPGRNRGLARFGTSETPTDRADERP